jgi:hypothetical protein
MSQTLPPLKSRTLTAGFAARTLRNLDFIKEAYPNAEVHPVTQVINSMLGLLVFPYEKEKEPLAAALSSEPIFSHATDLLVVRDSLRSSLPAPSIEVTKFAGCKDLESFFRRIRNSISHKNIEFSGADPDSRVLEDVKIILRDCPNKTIPLGPSDFDWEISMTAADLEALSRYVAAMIIA